MNADMIIRVMGRITDETLDMATWAHSPIPYMTCNTTLCFAGHTVVEDGHELEWTKEWHGNYEASETTDGRDIEELAQELLGLDDDQTVELFYEVNSTTVDELWEEVTRITGVKRPSLVSA
jgi:hypothetical protein